MAITGRVVFRIGACVATGLALGLYGTATRAATLSGKVSTIDGRPISGALVSLFNADKTRKETVYSDPDGNYFMHTGFLGALSMRVRTPYFRDKTKKISVTGEEVLAVDFAITKLTVSGELSDTLTASAHAATLKWQDPSRRATFVSQCHYCHQIGSALTRIPRTKDEWDDVIDRMESYLVLISPWDQAAFKKTLSSGFNGKPIKAIQTHDVSPELHKAKIEEWQVGDANSFIHDADVGHNGNLYGVDQGHDLVWELDRKTGKISKYKLPDSKLPVGGRFAGAALPIGIITGHHGPHSLAEDADGTFWITGSLSSTLISFNSKTKKFKLHHIGRDTLYPHTIRIDKNGLIWYTNAASNQVVRFDPKSETFDIIDLPSNGFARWLTDAFYPTVLWIASWFPRQDLNWSLSHHRWTGLGRNVLNMPYGIDIHPTTGDVWYSKLYADRIGRINPKTLKVEEFKTPMKGPRRLRFSKDGILWIPSFDEGALMRFDPKTKEFETFKLPRLAPNEYEVPYALNVHPKTGEIWITSNMSDRIFRFNPASETFISYPSPTRGTYLRDLVFTQDGKVCSTHSNLPAYGIEGGVPSFICLDPE